MVVVPKSSLEESVRAFATVLRTVQITEMTGKMRIIRNLQGIAMAVGRVAFSDAAHRLQAKQSYRQYLRYG